MVAQLLQHIKSEPETDSEFIQSKNAGYSTFHFDKKNGAGTDRFTRYHVVLQKLGEDPTTIPKASIQFAVEGLNFTDNDLPTVKIELVWNSTPNTLVSNGSKSTELPSLPFVEDLVTKPQVIPQPATMVDDIPLDLSTPKPTVKEPAPKSVSRKPRTKTPRPNYQTDLVCQTCNKTFGRQSGLVQHVKSKHSGPCPFKCGLCGKRFPTESQLSEHETRHSMADKPYKCAEPDCTRQFVHKNDLTRHFQGSHGVARFGCEQCEKRFVRHDHLLVHMQTHERKRQREEKELEQGKRRKIGLQI